MKYGSFLSLTLALSLILCLGGCTQSPAAQVTAANQTLTTTLQLIKDAQTMGLISKQQVEDAKPYIDAAVGAARAATHAAVVGDNDKAAIYLRAFFAANDELLKWRARVLKRE